MGFNAVPAVREWLARGAPLPAFGHPLYPWAIHARRQTLLAPELLIVLGGPNRRL